MKNTNVPQYSQKQEQLKDAAFGMSDKEINSYIEQFKQGEY